MKKLLGLSFLVLCLAGCATYKFQYGKKPYDKGYVVSRDGNIILEYTIGKDKSAPDLTLAKERFKRRRPTVEHYYKNMGYIESRFKETFWNPVVFFMKFVGGIFRWPFVAIADYKYEHNPKYRERIRKLEEEKELREEARLEELRKQLSAYIQKDLAKENP